jgi:predicted enzyme related to lactoylglutathione lyase
MEEVKEYTPGSFCWVELGTTDAKEAKKFYADIFGWDSNDIPAGPDFVYTMLQLEGKDLAALYPLQEEQKSQGVPPHWLSYVSVSNADEVVVKAKSLGGTVLHEPADVSDAGRMAVLQDPTGATFAVWQPNKNIGAQIVNQPGSFCWNELVTGDKEKAGKFYTDLFGWNSKDQDMGVGTYTEFSNGDRPAGGMFQITKEMGNVPPHWMVYFSVEDCDKSVEKSKSLGAKIVVPPTDIPEVGRFSVLQDPQGAVFSIIKLSNPV